MNNARFFLNWFAKSPIASFLRAFLAGGVGWLLGNVDSLNLHPILIAALAASLPFLLNTLNTQDERFGVIQEKEDEI